MKKWLVLLAAAMLMAACSNQNVNQQDSHPSAKSKTEHQDQDKAVSKQSTQVSALEKDKNADKPTEKRISQKKNGENKNVDSGETFETQKKDNERNEKDSVQGLISYRPIAGIQKTFVQNKQYEVTYDITAENQKYVQRVVHLGASSTLQILEWGKDHVSIVYQKQNPQDTSNQLNSFKTYEPPELLISLNQSDEQAEWKVIGVGKTVKVPYGKFKNVSVIQKTENARNGVRKVNTAYYAPQMGLIKEIDKVTGDNGYQTQTVLKSVTKLNP